MLLSSWRGGKPGNCNWLYHPIRHLVLIEKKKKKQILWVFPYLSRPFPAFSQSISSAPLTQSPQRLQEIGFLKRSHVHLQSKAAKYNFKPTKISLPKARVAFEAAYQKPCRWFIWDSTVIIVWWLKTHVAPKYFQCIFGKYLKLLCSEGKQTNNNKNPNACWVLQQ